MMRRWMLSMTAVVAMACAPAAASRQVSAGAPEAVRVRYVADLGRLVTALDTLEARVQQQATAPRQQLAFGEARARYKQVEWLVEYWAPSAAELINGAALPKMEADNPDRVLPPEGFQRLEELLWAEVDERDPVEALQQTRLIRAHVQRVAAYAKGVVFTDAAIFDAARYELARMTTLGLAGFDSPVALRMLPEFSAALGGLIDGFQPYADQLKSKTAGAALQERLAAARLAADSTASWADFDRLAFLVEHLEPTLQQLAEARTALGVPVPDEPRFWRAAAASLFSPDAFDPAAHHPLRVERIADTAAARRLGARLFSEPRLSSDGTRACSSCHVPERAYTDGLARSVARTGSLEALRNAPTILNAGLQAASFWDLRTTYLEDQVADVIGSTSEMHGDLPEAADRLNAEASYVAAFRAAFGDTGAAPATPSRIRSAITRFEQQLQATDSRFDRYVRGDRSQLTAEERLGFNVFMGKAKCGTCHFMPLFNGTVPPNFTKMEAEVLGVPMRATERGGRIDPDLGVFAVSGLRTQRHAFKTPTVRNAALTGPYFHNGSYRTLEAVVRFYELGGGAGIGIALENQTLPADRLELRADERAALVAFMRALSDSTSWRAPRQADYATR